MLSVVKSSGIYAIAALGAPLVSLVLAPFLTRHLAAEDYGALAILNTVIGLVAGITQLGLGTAFFRVYSWEYPDPKDRRVVISTLTTLLCIITIPVIAVLLIFSSPLAEVLFNSKQSLGGDIALAALAVLAYNLSIPATSYLRAEERPVLYVILSFLNLAVNLFGNILLVGVFHMGIAGSLLAVGGGYAAITVLTFPILLVKAGLRLRRDIAWSMLTFGSPQVLSLISFWVLQVSDRYLLGRFVSLAQTAAYTVAYTLGSVLSTLVVAPFTLAWPTAMFSIAKRSDAAQVFRLLFRWFSLLLLFAAFGLSIGGKLVLGALFPAAYAAAAPVIPVVATSIVFFGLYAIYMTGASVRRVPWMPAVFSVAAALTNFGLNLVLIPRFQMIGAAASTLIAYLLLASLAYFANQRIYPIPYEMGRFGLALGVGIGLYLGSLSAVDIFGPRAVWPVVILAVVLYTLCLLVLGVSGDGAQIRRLIGWGAPGDPARVATQQCICMHVLGVARIDARVLREATALVQAGFAVTIVDIERDRSRPREEMLNGVRLRHLTMPSWFTPVRFKMLFLPKMARILVRGALVLGREDADVYHAHDDIALPAAYIAARLHRKPLVFDAHEIPLTKPSLTHWALLSALARYGLRMMMKRCRAVITVSPPIVDEIQRIYGGPRAILVRNVPAYRPPQPSDKLRQYLDLPPGARIALYQGYFLADRWLEGLVRSAKFMAPDDVIVLMGQGGMQPALEALVAREKVADRVRFVPYIAQEDLLSWTASADLGLCIFSPHYSMNIRMCLPNKLFEYLMAGLPVLTSPLEAVVDIARVYDVGSVVPSLGYIDVGRSISAMLADSAALRRMRLNALAACRHDLRWDAECQRLIELHREVLGIQPAAEVASGVAAFDSLFDSSVVAR